jgi:hypothetical protein
MRALGGRSSRPTSQVASELKHTPARDLQELGGRKSYQTIVACYQRADGHTKAEKAVRAVRADTADKADRPSRPQLQLI